MSLFNERIPYKPFEYPEYYTEGWLKQAQAFWLHTEIPMSGDVKDWNEKLTKAEKNLVGKRIFIMMKTNYFIIRDSKRKFTKQEKSD